MTVKMHAKGAAGKKAGPVHISPAVGETNGTWFLGCVPSENSGGVRALSRCERCDTAPRGTWFLGRRP